MNGVFSFEVTEDLKIKVIYLGKKPLEVILTSTMFGGEIFQSMDYKFYEFTHWFIPPFSYRGCSYLNIYDKKTKKNLLNWVLPSEITKSSDKQNIICIGLNKTGTTSFEKDLTKIGYNFLPTSYGALKLQTDVYHGDFYSTFSSLNNPIFDGYQDLPFSLPKVFKKIYDNRPNDIYVLTVRSDVKLWVESVKKYYNWFIKDGNPRSNDRVFNYYNGPVLSNISNFCTPTFHMWGIFSFSDLDNKLTDVYNKHNDDVINFFEQKNSKNFITLDVSKSGELFRLTNWLGVKTIGENFSWENKSKK
jgi:hypothetical protein